jgi:hypothetical protein
MLALAKFIVDGGESSQLVPLKLLYFIHYMAFSTQTFLPVRSTLLLPVLIVPVVLTPVSVMDG